MQQLDLRSTKVVNARGNQGALMFKLPCKLTILNRFKHHDATTTKF